LFYEQNWFWMLMFIISLMLFVIWILFKYIN
jgi:hypothetical protein